MTFLLAALAAASLLISTRDNLTFVNGNDRKLASAGADAHGYRVLGTVADGTALVTFNDVGTIVVEAVSPGLGARRVRQFALGTGGTVARALDGFLVYDAGAQLVRRYTAAGETVGSPIAAAGAASEMLGLGSVTAISGGGRLSLYDLRGRQRKQEIFDAGALAPVGDDHFAVIDGRDGEVRVYDTNLKRTATIVPKNHTIRAIASASDGALAILTGTPSCTTNDAEVDLYPPDATAPSVVVRPLSAPVSALALSNDAIYVGNGRCRGATAPWVSVFARDGKDQSTIGDIDTATGIVPFAAPAAK